MSEHVLPQTELEAWGTDVQVVVCETCDWRFVLPAETSLPRCPHCFGTELELLSGEVSELPYVAPPEQAVPFAVSEAQLTGGIETFAKGIPLPPKDLNPAALRARLQAIYLPRWWVDAEVAALWQAEVGFDYEVVSHQERYSDTVGGWQARKVHEGRVRWEPRAGRLRRTYENVMAPALEAEKALRAQFGDYDVTRARPYHVDMVRRAPVRLPDRVPAVAWADAEMALRRRAGDECRQAAKGDHIREYRWQPAYPKRNWTLLLLPAYTTYYLDDEQLPQPVLIHGQTGRVIGMRKASLKRAQRIALILGLMALIIFVLSSISLLAVAVAPPLLVLGGIGLLVGMVLGLSALAPLIVVWRFNRPRRRPQER